MGSCNSGGKGGGGGGLSAKGELVLPDGSKIEFEGELKYGAKDTALTPEARKAIEAWEAKRVKNKVEYAYSVYEDGTPVGKEIRGSKGSVTSPLSYKADGTTFTHIHPRGDGMLGGTFSDADLRNFARNPGKTIRAKAKEGAYSISKTANFDAVGFRSFIVQANSAFESSYKSKANALVKDYRNGKISYEGYLKSNAKAFNTALVELHNTYSSGQKQYGYKYTLEAN